MKVTEKIKILVAIIIFYLLLTVTHIGCPIKFFTGISCAGCGMTRAWGEVFRLNFKEAFYYHPLYPLGLVIVLLLLLSKYINRKVQKILWIIIVVVFAGTYFYRLFSGSDLIVTANIYDSAIYQLIKGE